MPTDITQIAQLLQQWSPSALLVWVTWRVAVVEEKLNEVKARLAEHLIKEGEGTKLKYPTSAGEM